MADVPDFTEATTLLQKLAEILQSWPLYRKFVYTGADEAAIPPIVISLYCERCKVETKWEFNRPIPRANYRTGFERLEYQCRNCRQEYIYYFVYWKKHPKNTLFEKVGQSPAMEAAVPPEVEKRLSRDDVLLYARALRCRHQNYGIGAMSYMRRVLENKMNELLDTLAALAMEQAVAADVLDRMAEVKRVGRFSEKVEYGAILLPKSLRIGDLNPMDVLHDVASEGVHRLSDEESVDLFDKAKIVFDYFFGELNVEQQKRAEFAETLKELHARKAKKKAEASGKNLT